VEAKSGLREKLFYSPVYSSVYTSWC